MTEAWLRRIDHEPAPGAWNMAVDEALLEACMAGAPGFPCVRFYTWNPPALSLGFHQEARGAADLRALQDLGVDLVRRPTGGRAVLHERELTYAVIASSRRGPLAGPVMTTYRRISEALVQGLRRLQVPAELAAGDPRAGKRATEPCFSLLSASEISAAGAKLAGSVQLQRGGCLLQHGSIPLSLDRQRVEHATGGRLAGPARGVEQILGRAVEFRELADALAAGFAGQLGMRVRPGELDSSEEAAAERLVVQRYGRPEWSLIRPRRRTAVAGVAV